jgi:hypothetical protein
VEEIKIAQWIFESNLKKSNRFLLSIDENGETSLDGGHSDPNGVAKALKLMKDIKIIAPSKSTKHYMITIEEVPEYNPKLDETGINEESIDILNEQLDEEDEEDDYYKEGKRVKYIGASIEQIKWGSNDDPRQLLTEGETYTVDEVEVHSWHTKIYLKEFPDKKFNSVSFIPVE